MECDVCVTDGGDEPTTKKQIRTFKQNTTNCEINVVSKKKFAPQSKRKMKWVLNMFSDWRLYRLKQQSPPAEINRCDLDKIGEFSQDDLNFALSRFICEIKRIDGSDYPPNTLREVIIMVQMYLNENNIFWKLLEHPNFQCLRNVVDNTMKERTALGLGQRVSSEIISLDHEDKLFNSGCLGDSEPQQLLYTVIYMMGMHLALRGGVEHNRLRRPGFDPQVVVGRDSRDKECLIYTEDALQKTNQGGLKCKPRTKVVYVYPSTNVQRCPVRLFKKYIGLLPQAKSCKKLYLHAKKKVCPNVWFCDQPFGANKIASTVKDLCKRAGIEGKFTNHSLRATSASRMFHSGIPEQVIKEVTGHRSDCVRIYKRTCDDIREKASETIAGVSHETCSNVPNLVESDVDKVHVDECNEQAKSGEKECDESSKENKLSMTEMIKNVIKTRAEIARRKLGVKFNINKCKNNIARKILRQSQGS